MGEETVGDDGEILRPELPGEKDPSGDDTPETVSTEGKSVERPTGERALTLKGSAMRATRGRARRGERQDDLGLDETGVAAYERPGTTPAVSAGLCPYCGCPLEPRLYFCPGCATPYKGIQDVLPRARPRKLTDGERIAHRAPSAMPVFWTYFSVIVGCVVVALLASGPFDIDWTVYFYLSEFAILLTTIVLCTRHWRALKVQLLRFGFLRTEVLLGLAALVPLLAVNYYYHDWVIRSMGIDRDTVFRFAGSSLSKASLIVLFCAFPAVTEELAFRGLVQHWFQAAVKPFWALVYASALFTALHFSVVSAPYLFCVGMLLGWLKYRTASLYPSMLVHFLHNYLVLEFF